MTMISFPRRITSKNIHHGLLLRSRSRRYRPTDCSLSTATAAITDTDSDNANNSNVDVDDETTSSTSTLLHIDRQHVLHPYTSMTTPLPTFPVKSAKGVHITLNDGRKLIDGMSSWWAAVHGYRNPTLDEAMKEQIEESMSHVMFGGLTHRPAVELAGRLLQMVNNDYNNNNNNSTTNTTTTKSNNNEGGTAIDGFSDMDLEKMQYEYKLTKVFFSDSGSISVEVAMKMALQYWFTLHQQKQQNQIIPTTTPNTTTTTTTTTTTQKTKFLSLRNGYHGDTFGAMSVCDPTNGMHTMFAGILAQQLFVPSPTGPHPNDAVETLHQMECTLRLHHHELAAVIMEPIVQGAGGMKFYSPRVLKRARELCDEYDVLLIFDEIATGFGRTGTLFAGWQGEGTYAPWSSLDDNVDSDDDGDDCTIESNNKQGSSVHDDDRNDDNNEIVYPDILCLGKALTGGYMPLGATLTNDKLAHGISDTGGVFMHGPTFMANPLACSVSLASVNLLMQSPWQARVRNVERSLIEHLSPLAKLGSTVKEVRVLGAIGVCEMQEGLDRDGMAMVQRQLVEEGVWLRPFGKLLYTMPPFNCEELEDEHVRRIGEAMYNVASKL